MHFKLDQNHKENLRNLRNYTYYWLKYRPRISPGPRPYISTFTVNFVMNSMCNDGKMGLERYLIHYLIYYQRIVS